MDLLEALDAGPLCADGAMGTLLMARGLPLDTCFEELCLSQPETIAALHADYLAAGARLIGTNSFGANALRLARHGLEGKVNEINWQAAQIARQSARGHDVWVAGSVGPLGLTLAEARAQGIDAEDCFRTQIGALLDGGAQLIHFQTFQETEQLLLALHVKQSLHHCPAICSVTSNASGLLPDGQTVKEAFAQLIRQDAEILGLNCLSEISPELIAQSLRPEAPLAIALSAGLPGHEMTPAKFAQHGAALIQQGARVIGGCCGTTPAHIAALSEAILPREGEAPSEP